MNSSPDAETESAAPNALPPTALGAAIGAGIMGALVWGAIVHFANYEIGYVAWGIGALVGWAAAFMGARGQSSAIAAAVIALLSILGGRYLGLQLMNDSFANEMRAGLTADFYTEYVTDAAEWGPIDRADVAAVKSFMATHDYAETPISEDALTEFMASGAPFLDWMASTSPNEEQWRDRMAGEMDTSVGIEQLKASFSVIDLLFAFFGVSTAYALVMRQSKG